MQAKCEEVREQLSAWLDGELAIEEHAQVAAHLNSCAACRRELAQLTALNTALAQLAAPVPSGLAERVLARVQPSRRYWWQNLALAASLVMGIVLGGALARDFYPLAPENGSGLEMATLDDFHDFPQGSLGTILISYQAEEGNGT